jgi:hypothetical protein
MFRAICSSSGGTVCKIGMFCACYVGWLLVGTKYTNRCIYSASSWWAYRCLKHVQAVNHNKLKTNSASCWSCCTDTLRCTVNRTVNFQHILWTLDCFVFIEIWSTMFCVWVLFSMDCSVIAVCGHFTLSVRLSFLWMSGNWIVFSIAEVKSLIVKWAKYFHGLWDWMGSVLPQPYFFGGGLDINFIYVVYFSPFLLLVCFAIQTRTKNKYEVCHTLSVSLHMTVWVLPDKL